MKNLKHFLLLILSIVAFGSMSCNNNNESKPDNKDEAEKHNDAKFDNKAEKDAQFVVEASDISLTEMSLGQLAENNAMTDDTKELGRMMNRDHKKAYDDLASLAAKKSITVPVSMSDASKKDYDNLMEKKGADFDKKYCSMMVDGHKAAIDKFEKASKDAIDPDIQAWATNMLPTLRSHLDHAMSCDEKAKKLK